MKRKILFWLWIISYPCFAQFPVVTGDTLSDLNKSIIPKERVVEVYKLESGKTFQLKKGRTVWVYCKKIDNKIKIKRTKIIDIDEHTITFLPDNQEFQRITYSEYAITYIGFTSTGRIVVATVSNMVIIGAVAALYIVAILGDFYTRGSHSYHSASFNWIPFIPFKRNVSFSESKNGQKKWAIRIVDL